MDKTFIEDFLSQKILAVAGVSRSKRKFGNTIFRELKKRNYQVYPMNPHLNSFEGEPCYPNLKTLPQPVDGVVIVVQPSRAAQVVQEALDRGIRRIWMQPGAASEEALRLCREQGARAASGECLLMYLEPVKGIHRFHRWIWTLLGKLSR